MAKNLNALALDVDICADGGSRKANYSANGEAWRKCTEEKDWYPGRLRAFLVHASEPLYLRAVHRHLSQLCRWLRIPAGTTPLADGIPNSTLSRTSTAPATASSAKTRGDRCQQKEGLFFGS